MDFNQKELLSLLAQHASAATRKKVMSLNAAERIETAHYVLCSLLEQKYAILCHDLQKEYFHKEALHVGIALRNVPSKISFFRISGQEKDFMNALRLLKQAHATLYHAEFV